MTDIDDHGGRSRCLELFVAFGMPDGVRSEEGAGHYTLKWIAPSQLLAIATDLVAADEIGDDPEPIIRTWWTALAELEESDDQPS